ncbi:MAG: DUF5009 domain-containing protein [Planctomycetota bacterium]
MSPSAAPVPRPRWIALDALRGLAIAAMILVNNPGDWGHVYAPLLHARWHGCTFADLVFPAFLFVVGCAIVPSLGRASAGGTGPALRRVLRRSLWLVLLGLFLSAFPLVSFGKGESLFHPIANMRFPGVLQRIGVTYALGALSFLFLAPRARRIVLWAILLLYWPVLAFIPVDGSPPDLGSQTAHLAGWLDRAVFGDHIWVRGRYDPEGLLSTLPALGTVLLGIEAGTVMARASGPEKKSADLLKNGALLMAAGAFWGWFFPINKALWTSSYALWTGGVASSALGLLVHLVDVRGGARLVRPLSIYGVNALLVFVGSGILGRIVGRLITVTEASIPLKTWIHRQTFAALLDPYLASLAHAVVWVLGWFAVLWVLWRRGIVWKV